MAKSKITKTLESMLEAKFNKMSDFYVFECTYGWNGDEIVDCVMYDTDRIIHCYELKQSVSDFHSKAKLSFFGHKNYFVMPYSLYEKVKDEIPNNIGCYVACTRTPKEKSTVNEYGIKNTEYFMEVTDGFDELFCIKPAKITELKCDKEVLLSSMLRSISNDTNRMVRDHYEHTQVTDETWEKRLEKSEEGVQQMKLRIFNLEHALNNVFNDIAKNDSEKRKLLAKYSLGSIEELNIQGYEK